MIGHESVVMKKKTEEPKKKYIRPDMVDSSSYAVDIRVCCPLCHSCGIYRSSRS